ncbi:MAG: phosphotransferase [Muribaculaceae bacterium]|nr:phosphotransferase [Muribaculaceae bacterium]
MIDSIVFNAEIALKNLFEEHYNESVIKMVPITGSGSDRLYFRMYGESFSCIGTFVRDSAEGRCFVRLAQDFLSLGRAVPEIFAVSADFHSYLQEDLGDKSLFSSLNDEDVESLVKDTLTRLVSLQKTPVDVWKDDCMNKDFCTRQILWDLNYFKYEYLKPKEVVFDEDRLEDDFERLAYALVSVSDEFCGFMMRDCQSRNVMLTSNGPIFIDFQGGRKGPSIYDAVSFLWQARAGFSDDFKMSMLDFYCSAYCENDSKKKERMTANLYEMVLFRTLQVLGAYGFRGLVQKKSHFLLSIPNALDNLSDLIYKGILDGYPELKKVAIAIVADRSLKNEKSDGRLVVDIFSFSYKKGYPQDLSENGGGFIFDCRALHNPGRYNEYKQLTGKDPEVVEFLESRGEVRAFLKGAWSLTDPAIERYITRGFTHILIGFGCTGGQHRSVYSAEKTAAHIRQLFPEADVRLSHIENP